MNFKELSKFTDELQNHTYTCKCGHRIVMADNVKKLTCNWCYRTVYKNKKDEFMDRMEIKLHGRKDKRRI